MVGDIKAIETNYMGCRFRSRLEARWAVFFDAIGWMWEYEKQGYTIGYHDEDEVPWLPDFEISTPSGQHFYVEVKGDRNFFADGEWLERFDYGGGPLGFTHCGWTSQYDQDHKPLLILGDIPRFQGENIDFYATIIVHYKGIHGLLGKVTIDGVVPERDFYWDNISHGNGVKDFQVFPERSSSPDFAVNSALRTALGARFEHGEKPRNQFNKEGE
jgi:hypothetical protein